MVEKASRVRFGIVIVISMILLFLVGCSGNSALDRTVYTLQYDVTGTAALTIQAVDPDGLDVSPAGTPTSWTYQIEGTIDFANPSVIYVTATGNLQPTGAGSVSVTITCTVLDFEDIQTETVTNDHPTQPMPKTAAIFSGFPIQP